MAKPEWGAKRICHSCGARYYDMGKTPIICPTCGVEYDPDAFLKSRRARSAATVDDSAAAKRKAAKPAPAKTLDDEMEVVDEEVAEAEGLEVEVEDEDDADTKLDDLDSDQDDDLMEDASELGDDDGDDVIDIDTPASDDET